MENNWIHIFCEKHFLNPDTQFYILPLFPKEKNLQNEDKYSKNRDVSLRIIYYNKEKLEAAIMASKIFSVNA